MELLFNIAMFGIFVVLWAAFGYALVANQGGLDEAWRWLQGLPLPAQLLVGFLTLPVVIGLWIWETSWPLLIRLPLVIGIGAWNLLIFFPRGAFGR